MYTFYCNRNLDYTDKENESFYINEDIFIQKQEATDLKSLVCSCGSPM